VGSPTLDQKGTEQERLRAAIASDLAANSARSEIRIAIDLTGRRVVVDRWGVVEGASAELLIALAEPHLEAVGRGLLPENYPFSKPRRLLKRLELNEQETLRHQILRCRKEIGRLAKKSSCAPPGIDAVIENSPSHGYRLNPDSVRVVALAELTRREEVTPSKRRVTSRTAGEVKSST
jgi:hypothetical protein